MPKKKLDAGQKRLSRIHDYKRLFSSEQGQRVLSDLLQNHFVMRHTYTKGDPMGTVFKEGQRNVVLRIISILGIDESQMLTLIQETSDAAISNE